MKDHCQLLHNTLRFDCSTQNRFFSNPQEKTRQFFFLHKSKIYHKIVTWHKQQSNNHTKLECNFHPSLNVK